MHCLTVLNPTENKRQHAATLIKIVHYKTDQELRHKQQIKASSRQERRENCDYFQKKISMFFFDRLLSCYTLWQAKAVIVSHKMKLTLKSVNAETPCARCLISDGGVNHSSVQNGSCPQFPYWEIELETHVSNVTCMSVERPQSFLSSYFMLISCTFLRPITRNVKQTGWTEMLQEFRTSCVVGIRKRKCPRERTRVLLSRAYSRSSLCKQNNLHVNNLYTISALKYVTRLGKSKTKNVEKMYVLTLPREVRKR